jgi:hypothetical protein
MSSPLAVAEQAVLAVVSVVAVVALFFKVGLLHPLL